MVQLLDTRRVHAIGTSNFKPSHPDRIISATGHVPDVNQIQLSPAVTREASRAYHRDYGIVTRLRENLALFDFTLNAHQVAAISALNRGEAAATDSDRFGH
jgi:2,5-diketo-D-gluconate reductase A